MIDSQVIHLCVKVVAFLLSNHFFALEFVNQVNEGAFEMMEEKVLWNAFLSESKRIHHGNLFHAFLVNSKPKNIVEISNFLDADTQHKYMSF